MHSLTTCGECDPPTPGLNLRRNSKPDQYRTGDALVEEIRSRLTPGETLLDVGAGGGRLALPLALTCQTVTAVEPSPSMCSVLRETALEHHIGNVPIVESGWMEASVEPADVVLCSHVVYVVEEIGPFVRKMDSHARRLVLAVLFQSPPQSAMYGLWERVHGEKRHALPSLPEFLPVLEELGIRPGGDRTARIAAGWVWQRPRREGQHCPSTLRYARNRSYEQAGAGNGKLVARS